VGSFTNTKRASDQRAKFDRQNLQAYLLYAMLAVACGSREMFLHAEISRGSLTTMRRRTHMLRLGSASDDGLMHDLKAPIEERYKAYVDDEGKRRLGWGIYVSWFVLFNTLTTGARHAHVRVDRPAGNDSFQRDHGGFPGRRNIVGGPGCPSVDEALCEQRSEAKNVLRQIGQSCIVDAEVYPAPYGLDELAARFHIVSVGRIINFLETCSL